ncbi:MAG: beta-N-acetylhexosaminidase, partial [Alphaproteobacteria bacterium]
MLSGRDARPPKAVLFGCADKTLAADERALFAEADPLGFILFARNCENPDQLRHLIADLRAAIGRSDAPVLIDQEGGKVARLRAPHWRHPPPARVFAEAARRATASAVRATRLNARLIGRELAGLGITVDCAPVLDLPVAGAHDIIGDRAFGETPEQVTLLGSAVCDGLLDEAVLPVIKHLPGHGRALADSHLALPRVDAAIDDMRRTDFAPFRALKSAPWAMTAHVLYSAIDPDRPASASPRVIEAIMRGEIGFDGFLLSDDIGMQALSGSQADRAIAVLDAGCDAVLHCSGNFAEMREVANAVPRLTTASMARLERGEARRLAGPRAAEVRDVA